MNRIHVTSVCLLFLFSLFQGCVYADFEEKGGGSNPPVDPAGREAVYFSTHAEVVPTRAVDPASQLREKVSITIRAYEQATLSVPAAAPVAQKGYLAAANASLTETPVGTAPMYLAAGTYTFYALSANATGNAADSLPPALKTGSFAQTDPLKNTIDYLYADTILPVKSTTAYRTDIDLRLRRLSTSFVLTVVNDGAPEGSAILEAEAPTVAFAATNPASSHITLGNPRGKEITPAAPVTDQAKYTTLQSEGTLADGFTIRYVMLPMKGNATIPLTLTFPRIKFPGLEQENKKYTLEIVTPSGGFASGSKYLYRVGINGNGITFMTVSVADWAGLAPANGMPNEDIEEE